MIKSFKDKESERIWQQKVSTKLPINIQQRAFDKLNMLDASIDLNDLSTPLSNRLEKMAGDRKGQYSIRINDQWRICFVWKNKDAFDIEIVDYH